MYPIKTKLYMLGVGVSMLTLISASAYSNPQDPVVSAGNASFVEAGKKLDIHQTSDKAVIDWRSFDIQAGEHTEFHQPNQNSFTLNRVNSNSASQIDGMLSANGNIAVINPNGVYFGKGAQVDVGGLIATTSDINNNDFMTGTLNFDKVGASGATIVNEGSITAREAGLVGLVAPNVENKGTITARLGKVHLASGDQFTLDLAGDGLINVSVKEDQVRKIVNEGTISADGGAITLSTAHARETVDSLIVNKGTISANAVGMKNGKITLFAAGANNTAKTGTSTTLNEGVIEAKGDRGGDIEILGDHVGAMAGSTTDASGSKAGGYIKLGGEYQGQGETPTAKRTYVDAEAIINARATDTGDGGRVIVWADDTTRFYGGINAQGGDQSGDGGFVEVSGKKNLDFSGTVSTDARNGEAGTLLLDPTDIVISNASDSNVTGAHPFGPTIDDGPSNLNVTTLVNALATNHITVQTKSTGTQEGNITVADALSWNTNRRLTLNAHNKIIVNAPISARNGLTFIARDVDINASLAENTSATLYFNTRSDNITMGLAGGAGEFNLSNTDLDFIQDGWNRVYFGRGSGSATLDIGARTWNYNPMFYTRHGEIQVNGAQQFGVFSPIYQTRNLSINSTLTGERDLTIQPDSNVSVGVAGAAGDLNMSRAELDLIQDGFRTINIGRTNSSQTLTVDAYDWHSNVSFRTGAGDIQIDGTQNMAANTLYFYGRNLVMNADAVGTGLVQIAPDGNRSIGVNGGAGDFQIDSALLGRFDGFSTIRLGKSNQTQAINLNGGLFDSSLEVMSRSGVITLNGDLNFGSNNFTLRSDVSPVINGNLIGNGHLTLGPTASNKSMGIAGGTGDIMISQAELDRIIDGWDLITIGTIGNDKILDVGAYSWRDNVKFQTDSGVIQINGEQNFGSNDFTLQTDSNPQINADLVGTGALTIRSEAGNTSIGLNQSGGLNLTADELNHIRDGWSQIVIGQDNGTGQIRIGAHTWNDPLQLLRSTGTVRFDDVQNFGTNDLTVTSGGIDIRAALNGSGNLVLEQGTTNRSMGIAGASGSFNLGTAELDRISADWDHITFGRNDSTAASVLRAYTWQNDVTFRSGDGQLRFQYAQNFGDKDVTIQSNNLRIDQNMTGTGNLIIEQSDINKSVGIADAAGDLNISTAELNRLVDGWSDIVIGHKDGLGSVSLNAYNWNDRTTIRRSKSDTSGAIEINGNQTSADPLTFSGNTNVNVDLASDGNLFFKGPTNLGNDRTVSSATGRISMQNATATGILTLDAQRITGTYRGEDGLFNANTGPISARVFFDNLDLSASSATLKAGRIGVQSEATQEMANLIKINGALVTQSGPNFTFEGFRIGAPPLSQQKVTRTLRQTFDSQSQSPSNEGTTSISYGDYRKIGKRRNPNGAIYIHPELIETLQINMDK